MKTKNANKWREFKRMLLHISSVNVLITGTLQYFMLRVGMTYGGELSYY